MIRNVNLISMDSGQPQLQLHRDVFIVGGKFESITDRDEVKPPTDCVFVDGTGRFLIPGLADAHVHFNFSMEAPDPNSPFVQESNEILIRLFVAHGVTFVRSMWGSPSIVKLRDRCNAGETIGPSIITCGPLISAEKIPPAVSLSSEEDLKNILDEHVAAGYDALKIHSRPNAAATRLLLKEALIRKIPVYGHAPFTMDLKDVLQQPGFRTIEHLNSFVGQCVRDDSSALEARWPMMMKMYSEQDPLKQANWARLAKGSEIWFCPTLLTNQIDGISPEEFGRLLKDEDIRKYVSASTIDYWDRSLAYEKSVYQQNGIELATLRLAPEEIMTEFIRAKVPIIAGTDIPARPGIAGASLHNEISTYVRLGMTPWQAIESATVNVSRAVDQQDRFGKIGVGMRADAVMLSKNPLESIEDLSTIEAVILRGEMLDRKALDKLLADVEALVSKRE